MPITREENLKLVLLMLDDKQLIFDMTAQEFVRKFNKSITLTTICA